MRAWAGLLWLPAWLTERCEPFFLDRFQSSPDGWILHRTVLPPPPLLLLTMFAPRTSQSTPCQCDRFARKRRQSWQWKLFGDLLDLMPWRRWRRAPAARVVDGVSSMSPVHSLTSYIHQWCAQFGTILFDVVQPSLPWTWTMNVYSLMEYNIRVSFWIHARYVSKGSQLFNGAENLHPRCTVPGQSNQCSNVWGTCLHLGQVGSVDSSSRHSYAWNKIMWPGLSWVSRCCCCWRWHTAHSVNESAPLPTRYPASEMWQGRLGWDRDVQRFPYVRETKPGSPTANLPSCVGPHRRLGMLGLL